MDVKRKVLELLGEYGININFRDIDLVYRIGPITGKKPRCILVHFLHAEDKELTISRGKQMFIDYSVRLEDDFPPEIEKKGKE